LITYNTAIEFTCSRCGKHMQSRWKDLLGRRQILCRHCNMVLRMVGVAPSQAMLDAATQANKENSLTRRQRSILAAFSIPLEKRSTRAQVKVLSAKWPPKEWGIAMEVASRAHQRCTNPGASNFHYYGGRGIEFRFPSTAFMADWLLANLGSRPVGASIDRIEVNGHYEPGNLRWATKAQQAQNRSSSRRGT
jgi:DNA-directed RNA polymerase subunit RPC12/RpoP